MQRVLEQEREVVRQLLHKLIVTDLGSFHPDTFKSWIKRMDEPFRKIRLTMRLTINEQIGIPEHPLVHRTMARAATGGERHPQFTGPCC